MLLRTNLQTHKHFTFAQNWVTGWVGFVMSTLYGLSPLCVSLSFIGFCGAPSLGYCMVFHGAVYVMV